MKLTKTIRHEFCKKVLESIPAPDFAKMRADTWKKIIIGRLPTAVAKVYNKHPEFVAPELVADIVKQATNDFDRDAFLTDYERELAAALFEIESQNDRFKEKLSKLRESVMTAALSVTTVNGVKKLLPQYAEFLPNESKVDNGEVQQALFDIGETVKSLTPVSSKQKRKSRSKCVV